MVNSTSSHAFAPLPTEEQVEAGKVVQHENIDQVLDELLSKVGYGLFQKKLLVKITKPTRCKS